MAESESSEKEVQVPNTTDEEFHEFLQGCHIDPTENIVIPQEYESNFGQYHTLSKTQAKKQARNLKLVSTRNVRTGFRPKTDFDKSRKERMKKKKIYAKPEGLIKDKVS